MRWSEILEANLQHAKRLRSGGLKATPLIPAVAPPSPVDIITQAVQQTVGPASMSGAQQAAQQAIAADDAQERRLAQIQAKKQAGEQALQAQIQQRRQK